MLLSGCLVKENQHGYSHPPAYKDEAAGPRKQAGGHLLQGNPQDQVLYQGKDFGSKGWRNQEPAEGGWITRDEAKGTKVFFWAPHEMTTVG